MITAGALALYLSLREQIDYELSAEKDWAAQLFEKEFIGLKNASGDSQKQLAREFLDELNEVYLHKKQFVIFSIETNATSRIYSDNSIENVLLSLPKGFLSRKEGFYELRLNGRKYRLLIAKESWGTLAVGAENQVFFEDANEFKEILAVGVPLILLLVQKGVALFVVQELLGHEDLATTQIYSHLQRQNLMDAVNLL